MGLSRLSRRNFLSSSGGAVVAAVGSSLFWTSDAWAEMPMPGHATPLDKKLDGYIADYMRAMNAPGLTLGLADASGTRRVAGYGFANVDQRLAVGADHLFQIGSITKSFVALVMLQLREEGKLDLHKPVLEYLPGLPIATEFGPITAHHLLTHTSGLPENQAVFQSDPSARLMQGFKPGEHFHYCNAGFNILGMLAAKLDERPWRECVQQRILTPLEMNETVGVITTAARGRSATGYQAFWDDQVYPRQGRLAPAGNLVMDDTAGCIASTPGDMARYARMLLRRGEGPNGRIVSEESFALMATPYIKAQEFSPTASYGYGIAVDTLDGHKILRHTGGMVSFASSIHVDLDGGVAAFASINAMQGYRPTAVTEYSVRLLRAEGESNAPPAPPELADPLEVEHAEEFFGTFRADDGRTLVFEAQDDRLVLMYGGRVLPLQHAGGDSFLSIREGEFARYNFEFGRKTANENGKPVGVQANGNGSMRAPVVEVSYGPDWYVNAGYDGPRTFAVASDFSTFVGHYRSESAWADDMQVYVLKGKLVLSGVGLDRIGGSLFRVGEEPWTPDTAEFLHLFEGKTRLLRTGGINFWRVEVD